MRKVVISDIHGGLRGLIQVFRTCKSSSETQYIFIGDYVDGWSDSAETIRF